MMGAIVNFILDWAPLICWLIAMFCFFAFPPRVRILAPLPPSLRRRAVLGTIFFFVGLTLFFVQLLLKWLIQGYPS